MQSQGPSPLRAVLTVIGVLVVLWAISFGFFALSQRTAPPAGEMGVVRNGSSCAIFTDCFDNHKIRGIIPNGAGSTGTGLGSTVHYYPVKEQQRYFRLQTCQDEHGEEVPCEGADDVAIEVPTADGVQVGIEGTFYLNTAFENSAEGVRLIKEFDTQFGTRVFGEKQLYAWDGTSGWKAMLGVIVEPVIQNNLREVIAGVTCEQLVSSCALVQNNGSSTTTTLAANKANLNNVNAVQQKVNAGLQSDLNSTLQQSYFGDVRFKLTKVDLPGKVSTAIEDAQAAFAQVTQAQAKVKSAKLEAEANERREAGYHNCPACAQIDELKAIPSNVTTFAPGSGFSITAK